MKEEDVKRILLEELQTMERFKSDTLLVNKAGIECEWLNYTITFFCHVRILNIVLIVSVTWNK